MLASITYISHMASCNFRTLGLSKFHWFRRSFFTRIVLFHGGSTYGHQLGLAFIFLILWIFTSFWAPLLAEICVILEKKQLHLELTSLNVALLEIKKL